MEKDAMNVDTAMGATTDVVEAAVEAAVKGSAKNFAKEKDAAILLTLNATSLQEHHAQDNKEITSPAAPSGNNNGGNDEVDEPEDVREVIMLQQQWQQLQQDSMTTVQSKTVACEDLHQNFATKVQMLQNESMECSQADTNNPDVDTHTLHTKQETDTVEQQDKAVTMQTNQPSAQDDMTGAKLQTDQVSKTSGCDWSEHMSHDGKTYYHNKVTKQTTWKKPPELMNAEEATKQQAHVWKEYRDPHGKIYYFHSGTKESRWAKPDELQQSAGEDPTQPAALSTKMDYAQWKQQWAQGYNAAAEAEQAKTEELHAQLSHVHQALAEMEADQNLKNHIAKTRLVPPTGKRHHF